MSLSVEKTGKEKIAQVDPSGDKTPTLGRKRSFFEELFGNIGTISQPGLPGASGSSLCERAGRDMLTLVATIDAA